MSPFQRPHRPVRRPARGPARVRADRGSNAVVGNRTSEEHPSDPRRPDRNSAATRTPAAPAGRLEGRLLLIGTRFAETAAGAPRLQPLGMREQLDVLSGTGGRHHAPRQRRRGATASCSPRTRAATSSASCTGSTTPPVRSPCSPTADAARTVAAPRSARRRADVTTAAPRATAQTAMCGCATPAPARTKLLVRCRRQLVARWISRRTGTWLVVMQVRVRSRSLCRAWSGVASGEACAFPGRWRQETGFGSRGPRRMASRCTSCVRPRTAAGASRRSSRRCAITTQPASKFEVLTAHPVGCQRGFTTLRRRQTPRLHTANRDGVDRLPAVAARSPEIRAPRCRSA